VSFIEALFINSFFTSLRDEFDYLVPSPLIYSAGEVHLAIVRATLINENEMIAVCSGFDGILANIRRPQ